MSPKVLNRLHVVRLIYPCAGSDVTAPMSCCSWRSGGSAYVHRNLAQILEKRRWLKDWCPISAFPVSLQSSSES